MKSYPTKDIRNVGIVGHGGTGKTQLVSSLLYTAGLTPRWGKVADGSSTTDWDDAEVTLRRCRKAFRQPKSARRSGSHARHARERGEGLLHRHDRLLAIAEAVLLSIVTITAAWS